MTSVIYVNSSSDSEEEGPPDAKRARREHAKLSTTSSKSLPSKLLHTPKASLTQFPVGVKNSAAMGTSIGIRTPVVGSVRSMNIPSGITVTKHNNINGNINIVSPKPSLENNNNNNNNNNSLKGKTIKLSTGFWSKAPTTLATITSVPSTGSFKLSAVTKASQKPTIHQHQQQPQLQQLQQKTLQQQQQQLQQKTTILQKQLTVAQQKNALPQQQQQKLSTAQPPQLQQKQEMLQLTQQQQQQLKPQMPQLQLQQKLQAALSQQKPILLQQQQLKLQTSSVQLPVSQKLTAKPKQQLQQQQQQRLPTLQKPTLTPTAATATTKPIQLPVTTQKQPPPAHSATTLSLHKAKQQQQQQSILAPPPPAHNSLGNTTLSPPPPPLLAKLTPMSMLSKSSQQQQLGKSSISIKSSAARTLPYKTKSTATPTPTTLRNVQQVTTATPLQSMTAGATPPLRLLATPPHCAAALNEPLLLNLPSTTSITPQLTPTTTPPPTSAVTTTTTTTASSAAAALKVSFPGASISPVNKTIPKRVQPITVLKKSDDEWRKHIAQQQIHQLQQQQKPKEQPTIVLVESPPTTPPTDKPENEPTKRMTPTEAATTEAAAVAAANTTVAAVTSTTTATTTAAATTTTTATRAPLVTEYAALLQLCREIDKSKDMERLIDIKLIKYYYSVHENFVRSRGFRKQLEQIMELIRKEPEMIYFHLKCIVDELKVRRKAKAVPLLQEDMSEEKTAASNDAKKVEEQPSPLPQPQSLSQPTAAAITPSTGNKRTDERIRKLNRTLYTITKRISALEEADVDWNDDDDSSYLQVERYKKRACQIYEKICDLTGESKSAHRQMKQPILFKDSPYPQFNRTLSAFVNRMHEFPDYHDVLQLLEHCNKDKDLGLATFEMKRIAHDAFVKVGRLLQARRMTDLYETVTHFTANAKDPASSDAALLAKLNENNKKQTKISDVLEKFAREQDLTTEEQREARLKEKQLQAAKTAAIVDAVSDEVTPAAAASTNNDDEKPCTSAQAAQAGQVQVQSPTAETPELVLTNGLQKRHEENGGNDNKHESDSDEDEEDDDDETDEDVDTFVDNFKANGLNDISDAESETELNAAPKTLEAAAHVIVNNVTRVKTAAHIDKLVIDNDDKALPNGKFKQDAPAAQMLKIMSVSSLNASVAANSNNNKSNSPEQPPKQQQKQQKQKHQQKKQHKIVMDTEIVISDEES